MKQELFALKTRAEILSNLARQPGLTPAEQAALSSDHANATQQIVALENRQDRLTFSAEEAAVFSPLGGEAFNGSWVTPALEQPLATVSVPTETYVSLRIDQSRLEMGLATVLRVRLVGDPSCEFASTLATDWGETVASNGRIEVLAKPTDALPECAEKIRNGEAIVAHIPLPPRSVATRLRARTTRLLQERLPFETEQ